MQVCSEADLHLITLASEGLSPVAILAIENCPEY